MNNNNLTISIICPCYNEEEVIVMFIKELYETLIKINRPYEILFINDGSKDNTLKKLFQIKKEYENIRIINLSRNFGKEAALTAGIDLCKGEVIIPIDTDLQHPPKVIINLINEWEKGYDVVLAKRKSRETEGFLKKINASMFYKLHNLISTVDIPENVGDFRLITRKVANAIKQLPENQRFMKGIFAWVGFEAKVIEYEVENRKAGKSSFHGWKLWNYALDGISSFSTVPLRIWTYIGIFFSFLAFLYANYIIIQTLIFGINVPGYASTMTMILFLGGVQLVGIGVLGEYIGRIYLESKNRPNYIIENEY